MHKLSVTFLLFIMLCSSACQQKAYSSAMAEKSVNHGRARPQSTGFLLGSITVGCEANSGVAQNSTCDVWASSKGADFRIPSDLHYCKVDIVPVGHPIGKAYANFVVKKDNQGDVVDAHAYACSLFTGGGDASIKARFEVWGANSPTHGTCNFQREGQIGETQTFCGP